MKKWGWARHFAAKYILIYSDHICEMSISLFKWHRPRRSENCSELCCLSHGGKMTPTEEPSLWGSGGETRTSQLWVVFGMFWLVQSGVLLLLGLRHSFNCWLTILPGSWLWLVMLYLEPCHFAKFPLPFRSGAFYKRWCARIMWVDDMLG